MGIERRRFPRLFFNVEVVYKVLAQDYPDTLISQSKNISACGICIVLLEDIAVGTILDLNFLLPEMGETISAAGRVVWTSEFTIGDVKSGKAYDVGVEYIKIAPEDQKKIQDYVVERL